MKYDIKITQTFKDWFEELDTDTSDRLLERLDRVSTGNLGDHKTIAKDLFELRCFFGGGIRIYFTIRNQHIVLLLSGGNKSTQSKDIKKAQTILKKIED
ncbi:addiction module antitoxin RelB [Nitrosomonas sp. PY1]|uniref:type II toxin-antitoxin system RelE/ParE family toxin n=1 Tax=Nitrosomonas sp. PY1 TaxID=1803906 RepID=UPI001FC802DE|nr:type II toxin-antitoxin system RelE/ParE family toxin [Nitrosomonas sp. PY1]GKS68980.1 addiction module antitoxin RelB [Nitrosomonas sp. PY1]